MLCSDGKGQTSHRDLLLDIFTPTIALAFYFLLSLLQPMSLITDANFLIHEMRIKLLRTDERGERIISFRPTVMSDDYIRLAAPTYPEMQYCYSPVYDSYLTKGGTSTGTNLISSPRTKRSHYRLRKKENMQLNPPAFPKPAASDSGNEESVTDAELGYVGTHKLAYYILINMF